jgi:CheY-like chemotaxis protein
MRPQAGGPAGPNSIYEMLLAEIRAIQKTQREILALLQGGASSPSAAVADDEERTAKTAAVAAGAAKRGGQPSVLIVDDDPAAQKETAAALGKLGVRTAKDGNDALASIALEKPSVIVLELDIGGQMPGQDLINMVKATMEWVDIPIVLYTKRQFTDVNEARHECGVDDIVPKGPGAARKLAGKVAVLLQKA